MPQLWAIIARLLQLQLRAPSLQLLPLLPVGPLSRSSPNYNVQQQQQQQRSEEPQQPQGPVPHALHMPELSRVVEQVRHSFRSRQLVAAHSF